MVQNALETPTKIIRETKKTNLQRFPRTLSTRVGNNGNITNNQLPKSVDIHVPDKAPNTHASDEPPNTHASDKPPNQETRDLRISTRITEQK